MRMRKNCTRDGDFEAQSNMLSKMFKDKGYHDTFLEKERIKVRDLNRESLLMQRTDTRRTNEDMGTSIVLDYSLERWKKS